MSPVAFAESIVASQDHKRKREDETKSKIYGIGQYEVISTSLRGENTFSVVNGKVHVQIVLSLG